MYQPTNQTSRPPDIVVVGGGLAGLTAAAAAAVSGRSVIVFEQARELGGRALTNVREGVHFNLGPRALYRGGRAFHLLRELGVPIKGAIPSPGRSLLTLGGKRYNMPVGLRTLVSSRVFGLGEKWRFARFLKQVGRIDPRRIDHLTTQEWVEQTVGRRRVAQLLHTFLTLSTYANDPRHLSAGAALDQLQLALAHNVLYIDGGWQSLVEGLRSVALRHGAVIHSSTPVDAIRADGESVTVQMRDGSSLTTTSAIVAADPQSVIKLLELPHDHPVTSWSRTARPAHAACLDVALTHLPCPKDRFALGLDQPTYFSVHSAAAKLAPQGVAVLHAMKYLGAERNESAADSERELEVMLGLVQPGWRRHVLTRRFLPNMVVTHGVPLASQGGASGRPSVEVADRPGVFLAGDWVGPTGQLADAAVASGDIAGRLAATRSSRTPQAASPVHAGS